MAVIAFLRVYRDAAAIDRRTVRLLRLQARCVKAARDALDIATDRRCLAPRRERLYQAASDHLDYAERLGARMDALVGKRPVLDGAEVRQVSL